MEATNNQAETAKTETDIFTTKSEKKMLNAPKVNVLGKIDLSTLNQSTRPKKSRRRRSARSVRTRLSSSAATRRNANASTRCAWTSTLRRTSPTEAMVASRTVAAMLKTSNKNKKKNRNRGGQQKPAEVNDEDVARQVKETLARLTNKQNQNKKRCEVS